MKIDWNKVEEGYSLMQTLEKENKQLKSQLQQKENIIKEVKECIDNFTLEKLDDFEKYKMIPLKETWIGYSILEILDKENK